MEQTIGFSAIYEGIMQSPVLPENIAFKEWSLVCDALRDGDQSILLRKGGISEGRGGFSFSHPSFWFFPTFFHDQLEGVIESRLPSGPEALAEAPDMGAPVEFDLAAELMARGRIDSWEQVEALDGLHILKETVLKERFEYEEDRCLWIAVVRVYRASPVRTEPMSPKFKGCRSWIQLPEPESYALSPVLANDVFGEQLEKVRQVVPNLS